MFYEAFYHPSETRHLKTDAKKWIGKRLALQEGWRLTDGPHKGQYCYIPSQHFGCIPACDLKSIKNISYVRWREIHESLT